MLLRVLYYVPKMLLILYYDLIMILLKTILGFYYDATKLVSWCNYGFNFNLICLYYDFDVDFIKMLIWLSCGFKYCYRSFVRLSYDFINILLITYKITMIITPVLLFE